MSKSTSPRTILTLLLLIQLLCWSLTLLDLLHPGAPQRLLRLAFAQTTRILALRKTGVLFIVQGMGLRGLGMGMGEV